MNSKDGVVKTPVVLPESGVPVDVDFDYAELLARYDEERDARLARPTSRSKGADAHDEEALRPGTRTRLESTGKVSIWTSTSWYSAAASAVSLRESG